MIEALVVIGMSAMSYMSLAMADRVNLWPAVQNPAMGALLTQILCLLGSSPFVRGIHQVYRRGGKPWYSLNQLVSSMAILTQLMLLASSILYLDTRSKSFRAAIEIGEPSISISNDTIAIDGPIGAKTFVSIKALTDQNEVRSIIIDSPGGLINVALQISGLIKGRRIAVHVAEHCESACVIIAKSSNHLSASKVAVFGFHQGSSLGGTTSSLADFTNTMATDEMIASLRELGIPNDILDKAIKTSPDNMFYVSATEMYSRGIINELTD